MTKDRVLEVIGYVAVFMPAALGFVGLGYHWNIYTCASLMLGSVVLLATYEFAKR